MKKRYLTSYITTTALTLGFIVVVAKLLLGLYTEDIFMPILFLVYFVVYIGFSVFDLRKLRNMENVLYMLSTINGKRPRPSTVFINVTFSILFALGLTVAIASNDGFSIFTLYILTINSFTVGNLFSGTITEKGLNFRGQYYTWEKISGIILNKDNSMEIRIKGSNEPFKLFCDIEQRSDISKFLSMKFNPNLFIDKLL